MKLWEQRRLEKRQTKAAAGAIAAEIKKMSELLAATSTEEVRDRLKGLERVPALLIGLVEHIEAQAAEIQDLKARLDRIGA